MELSRRDLFAASALLLARPGFARSAEGAAAPTTQPELSGARPLVLCWNENPYGPSPAARAAVSSTIGAACRYPAEDIDALIEALAAHEGVTPGHIVTGTGSGELLCALGLLHGHDNGEIIAAEPTYAELTNYARQAGASVKSVPVDKQLRHDLAAMHAAVSPRTRAIYVCNPNNPTGTAIPAAQLKSFIAALPERVTTIVDEAYMDFADSPGVASVADMVGTRRVVVLRTFSKIHGMAGLRVGYGIAHPDTAAEIAATRMSSANIFAMRAARASLADKAFLTDCRQRIVASRRRITAELSRLGLGFADPQGNFVYFDTGMPLQHFSQQMRARNILVGRYFAPFDNWCRITIGTEPEVAAFLTALRAIVPSRRA